MNNETLSKKVADACVLDESLKEFSQSLADRCTGRKTKATSLLRRGVKYFLRDLPKESIRQLDKMGQDRGFIDIKLQEEKVMARTIRVYLSTLVRYLRFLSSSRKWLTHLGLSADDLDVH